MAFDRILVSGYQTTSMGCPLDECFEAEIPREISPMECSARWPPQAFTGPERGISRPRGADMAGRPMSPMSLGGAIWQNPPRGDLSWISARNTRLVASHTRCLIPTYKYPDRRPLNETYQSPSIHHSTHISSQFKLTMASSASSTTTQRLLGD